MTQATDLQITSGVRRELSSRRIDLTKLKFNVSSGEVHITGLLAFVGMERRPDEVAVELKFMESSIKAIPGVTSLEVDLENWTKTDLGQWSPQDSSRGPGGSATGTGEGFHCPECETVFHFCPCCGKPLIAGMPHKAAPTPARRRILPRKLDHGMPAPPRPVSPAIGGGAVKPMNNVVPVTKPSDKPLAKPVYAPQKDHKPLTTPTPVVKPVAVSTVARPVVQPVAHPVESPTIKPPPPPPRPPPTSSPPAAVINFSGLEISGLGFDQQSPAPPQNAPPPPPLGSDIFKGLDVSEIPGGKVADTVPTTPVTVVKPPAPRVQGFPIEDEDL